MKPKLFNHCPICGATYIRKLPWRNHKTIDFFVHKETVAGRWLGIGRQGCIAFANTKVEIERRRYLSSTGKTKKGKQKTVRTGGYQNERIPS